jgi:hypothetical protein
MPLQPRFGAVVLGRATQLELDRQHAMHACSVDREEKFSSFGGLPGVFNKSTETKTTFAPLPGSLAKVLRYILKRFSFWYGACSDRVGTYKTYCEMESSHGPVGQQVFPFFVFMPYLIFPSLTY